MSSIQQFMVLLVIPVHARPRLNPLTLEIEDCVLRSLIVYSIVCGCTAIRGFCRTSWCCFFNKVVVSVLLASLLLGSDCRQEIEAVSKTLL